MVNNRVTNKKAKKRSVLQVRNYSSAQTPKQRDLKSNKSSLGSGTRSGNLLYRPLELDNESSSESIQFSQLSPDKRTARTNQLYKTPNNRLEPKPTVSSIVQQIELPTKSLRTPATPHHQTCTKTPETRNQLIPTRSGGLKRIRPESVPQQIPIIDLYETPRKSTRIKRRRTDHTTPKQDQLLKQIERASQCITPPKTPEKVEEKETEPEPQIFLSTFVPGSCKIEEVLRLYGSAKKDSEACKNESQIKVVNV